MPTPIVPYQTPVPPLGVPPAALQPPEALLRSLLPNAAAACHTAQEQTTGNVSTLHMQPASNAASKQRSQKAVCSCLLPLCGSAMRPLSLAMCAVCVRVRIASDRARERVCVSQRQRKRVCVYVCVYRVYGQ